jgi:KDO2-lipid IV(A) lauroyltransferase
MTVLARETYDPRLASVYDRLRAGRGVKAIYRGHPGAPTRIVRTLREGGVLAVPMDLRSRVQSVEATFLGQQALVPVGPARIALRMGAAVVVGTVAPDQSVAGGLRITCSEIPTGDLALGPEGERALTGKLAAELTSRIRDLPEEWVWMHDRFPGNPAVS